LVEIPLTARKLKAPTADEVTVWESCVKRGVPVSEIVAGLLYVIDT
jgi:hypothetical protein